jgi:hypothetical protein
MGGTMGPFARKGFMVSRTGSVSNLGEIPVSGQL